MPNLLRKGAEWLTTQLHGSASESIQYLRSGEAELSLMAVIGKTDFEQQDDQGNIFQTRSVDFLIRSSDLDFGAGAVEPKPGDKIAWNDGAGTIHTYEVVSSGFGGAFRYADEYRKMIRVYTTYTKTESA